MATYRGLEYHRLIVGYHGCSRETAERVLLRGEDLKQSVNDYDWLGTGIYFWEHGPRRALEFAEEQVGRKRVKDPTVVGAYIHLGRCFDLLDVRFTGLIGDAFPDFEQAMSAAGDPLPENLGTPDSSDLLLRKLDCAVINWYLALVDAMEKDGPGPYYQTVRGAFTEGPPAFRGSCIRAKSHVQVAIRDVSCILGYFSPRNFE